MNTKPLNTFETLRLGREEFYVDDLSDYELNKEYRTYGLKVFKNLLDALNKTKRSEARYALLVETEEGYVELSYFKREEDARYAVRKFRKIARLSFKEAYKLSVAPLKEIDLSA